MTTEEKSDETNELLDRKVGNPNEPRGISEVLPGIRKLFENKVEALKYHEGEAEKIREELRLLKTDFANVALRRKRSAKNAKKARPRRGTPADRKLPIAEQAPA